MPSRGVVAAIFLFWLGSTSLLIQRQVLPRWRAGEAPAYPIELTDEVGAPQAEWEVVHQGDVVGRGISQVRRRPDRTFEMYQRFKFDRLELPVLIARLTVRKLESTYRVTRDGNLLGLTVLGRATLSDLGGPLPLELEAELTAEVRGGVLEPQLKLMGTAVDMPGLGTVDVSEHGSILNPLHLFHRLPGLREGQRWKVPLLDPLKLFSAKGLVPAPLGGASFPFLEAQVGAGTLEWDRQEVPCLHVVYREPGKDPVAATWVRRHDALVLAQEARHGGTTLTIRRIPAAN